MSDRVSACPLADALLNRRSRRFAKGMRLSGGLLAYASRAAPEPPSPEEEAALAARRAVAAAIATCEYAYRRYGRFSRPARTASSNGTPTFGRFRLRA
jgi:hypothetical protein